MARKLIVEIIGDASSLERSFQRAGAQTQTFGSRIGGLGKTAGLAAGAAGIGALTVALNNGIKEYTESIKVAAQTERVIRNTGGVANVTAKHVDTLAKSILNYSGIDDEAIKNSENLLLAFTGVRNEVGKGRDIFDRATKVIIDFSVATGRDARGATQLFGKALNEIAQGQVPTSIRGLGKLSQSLRDEIEAHTLAGDAAGAQGLLLAELEKRYGGAAKAAGETLPGQINILKERFNNLAGEGIAVAIEKMDELRPTIETLIGVITDLKVVIEPLARLIFDVLFTPLKLVADLISGDFSKAWEDVKQPIIDVRDIFVGFWSLIKGPWEEFTGAVIGGLNSVKTTASNVAGAIAGFFTAIPSKIGDFSGALLARIQEIFGKAGVGGWVTGVVSDWAGFIAALPGKIADFGADLLGKIKGFVEGAGIGAFISGKVADFAHFFFSLPGKIGDELSAGVKGAVEKLKSWFNDLFGWLPGWAKDILGIHSPSTVFAEIGEHIVGGLIEGLGNMAGALKDKVVDVVGAPIDWAKKLIGGLTSAVFGGEGAGTPSANVGLGAALAQSKFGWGANEFEALRALWQGESGWSQFAENPSSGAYGIPQALPPTKMPFQAQKAGGSIPYFQIMWGLKYILDRYGDPINAYRFWLSQSPHWYAAGGIFTKPSIIGVGEAGPEAVIPLSKMAGRAVNITVNLPNYLGDKEAVVREIRDQLKQVGRNNAIDPLAAI